MMLMRGLALFLAMLALANDACAAPVPAAATPSRETAVAKRLFEMSPREVDAYLRQLARREPDLRRRIVEIARRNIGQPYELFLLGEFPYELADAQPLFDLTKSDCLVFAEHTYAMALSSSWEEFFWMLQRIRYRDGVIGVTTRNHYQEADWNPRNAWLLTDATREVGGGEAVDYVTRVDRKAFFKAQFGLEREVPVEDVRDAYLPWEAFASRLAALRDGDLINIVSSRGTETLVTHVGLVATAADGSRHIIHSAAPRVREESFADFVRRARQREADTPKGKTPLVLRGFKVLRLNERPEPPPMQPQPRPRH